jgi:uncharacterized membrane-anchored protein
VAGYWVSALLFALAIAAVAVVHFALGLDAVWSFWIAYVLTRPLGASVGDYLSQPTAAGGWSPACCSSRSSSASSCS